MSANEIYAKGYADGYENGRMSKERVFFPPCEDCNKKMDEVRKAYGYWKVKKFDIITELENIKAEIEEANVHLNQMPSNDYYSGIRQGHWGDLQIIEKHIAELKGE